MTSVIDYYENYDEENRLKDNARKVEFIVTSTNLDQYIEPSHKILELGAGTGIYSFYYSTKGNEIVATDLSPKHVEIMK